MSVNSHEKKGMTICVSGAPSPLVMCPPDAVSSARILGSVLARHRCTVLTSTTTGFPSWVALSAQREQATVIGFSGASSAYEHETVFRLPREGYTSIIYSGFGSSGASIMAIRSSDAVIFGCGGMTSILECMTAIEEEKPIGILEGSWETDDVLMTLLEEQYPDYEHVIIDTDPENLVRRVMSCVNTIYSQK